MASRHITVTIERPAEVAYDFACEPENLPRWASGLGRSVRLEDGRWVAEAPFGWVVVEFVPRNEHLVLDHDVTMPTGVVVRNPMRVLPDGPDRCEVVFSLRRAEGSTDEEHEVDAATILADLKMLKRVLEGP